MSLVHVKQAGRVVTATLSNPPSAYMTTAMVRELDRLVARWEDDDSVGAVILTGAHPERFLAHFDVSELLTLARETPNVPAAAMRSALTAAVGASHVGPLEALLGRTPAGGLLDLVAFHRLTTTMGRSGVVYIAALNGSALGGGCEFSLSCDFRIMADGDFVIGQPEAMLGFPPGGGGTQRLVRLLGESRALEVALDPSPYSPAEALALGLVTQVVPPAELMDAATAMAQRLSGRPKSGNRATKRAVRDGGSRPLDEALRTEAVNFIASFQHPESIELMAAYVEISAMLGDAAAYDAELREAWFGGATLDEVRAMATAR